MPPKPVVHLQTIWCREIALMKTLPFKNLNKCGCRVSEVSQCMFFYANRRKPSEIALLSAVLF